MIVSLPVVTDVLGKPDFEGFQKVVKKNIVYNKMFETRGLLAEEYITSRGNVSNRWCGVRYEGQYFIIRKSFSEIVKIINPVFVHGFKIKGNKT